MRGYASTARQLREHSIKHSSERVEPRRERSISKLDCARGVFSGKATRRSNALGEACGSGTSHSPSLSTVAQTTAGLGTHYWVRARRLQRHPPRPKIADDWVHQLLQGRPVGGSRPRPGRGSSSQRGTRSPNRCCSASANCRLTACCWFCRALLATRLGSEGMMTTWSATSRFPAGFVPSAGSADSAFALTIGSCPPVLASFRGAVARDAPVFVSYSPRPFGGR